MTVLRNLLPKERDAYIRSLTVQPFGFGGPDIPPPPTFECFTYESDTHDLVVPAYWAQKEVGIEPEIIHSPQQEDDTHNWTFEGKLRSHQEDIMRVLEPVFDPQKKRGGGILSIQCGGGKTCCAIYILCRLKVKTLIVVHKEQLLYQWIESIKKFTSLDIGQIRQNKIDAGPDKPVVIGMLQSLSLKDYPEELLSRFSFLIVDEVHNVATKSFSKLLMRVTPPYTLGLSATPQRADGTSKVFHWFLGPMLYRITAREATQGRDSDVSVRIYRYGVSFKEIVSQYGLSIMITKLAKDSKRTTSLVKIITHILKADPNRNVLVLSSRIEQLKEIHKDIPTSGLYTGGIKQRELDATLQNAQVLLATYEMANEGFDLPRLNTLVFATPRTRVEQAVGRILRKRDPETPPLIIDVVDELPTFIKQGQKRQTFYKSLGYTTASHEMT